MIKEAVDYAVFENTTQVIKMWGCEPVGCEQAVVGQKR